MIFWIVIGLMITSGISGVYCGIKLDTASPFAKMVKFIAVGAGVSISVVAVYLLIEYPKTSYGKVEEYKELIQLAANVSVD